MDYTIEPKEGKKGRSFSGYCIAAVVANGLWESGGGGNEIRPVWAMFCGTESELRPFVTNLRLGRKAEPAKGGYRRSNAGERLEFLKSDNFYTAWQREPEGSIATLYHPELFRLDPGMVDPTAIRFMMLVPRDWAQAQQIDDRPMLQHAKRFKHPLDEAALKLYAPSAYLFAAYLDRRTRCPLLADNRFYMQLLLAALESGLASRIIEGNLRYHPSYREDWGHNPKHACRADGLEDAGIALGISFSSAHEPFEKFLAEQVELFFEMTEPKKGRRNISVQP